MFATNSSYVPGQVLVRLKGGVQPTQTLAQELGARVVHRFDLPAGREEQGDLVQLQLPEGVTTEQAVDKLAQDRRVVYATPNRVYRLTEQPNDLHPNLWGLRNIHAPEAWNVTTGTANGPVIAVLDTGADWNHPDLKANLWTNPGEIPGNGIDDDGNGVVDDVHGYNALDDNGSPVDGHSHGTHVAGTIGAVGNNGLGVTGVNWTATIMPVKVFSDRGFSDSATIVKGMLYASKMGARITSNSYGGFEPDPAVEEAFRLSPALHVIAAGNDTEDLDSKPNYPASYPIPNAVVVAATDSKDRLARFSSYGAHSVDLAAPGVDVFSTMPGGQYGSKSGTSMATPHVAGVAGLILAAHPDASNEELRRRLLASADPLPGLAGKVLSGGRLNAAGAVERDQQAPGAPGALAAFDLTPRGFTLSWTAPGDDADRGQARAYCLELSEQPDFSQAWKVQLPAPKPAGQSEQASVAVRARGHQRPVYARLSASDNVGNVSPAATLAVEVPALPVAFEDRGPESWIPGSAWGQVDGAWTDSPDGNYQDSTDSSLVSRPFSLKGLRDSKLTFEARYSLERWWDYCSVDVSRDGKRWRTVESFNGERPWGDRSIDLSDYDGQTIQLRFRLTSDDHTTRDGFWMRNLLVSGES